MGDSDLDTVIDELLRRPLLACHVRELHLLKEKKEHGELREIDRIYIRETWQKFRSLRPLFDKNDAQKSAAEDESAMLVLEAKLAKATQALEQLRDKCQQFLQERDQWQARAEQFAVRLAQVLPKPERQDTGGDSKFEQARRAFAKMYHPNSLTGGSRLDVALRGEVFKEFWIELERIEAET